MMPVAAYNAAMLPAISQNVEQPRAGRNHAGLRSQLPNMPQYDAMQITTVIARWVWIIPVVATLVRCRNAGAHADDMGAALIAVLLALHVVLGFMVGLLCARNVTLTRQNRRLQDSKRDQIRRLRSQLAESEEDRAASVRVATLAERTRIAREIHDNVGHMLTRAIMQSEAAQVVAQVSGQEQAAQGFAQIHDTVGEAMTLVRGAVHDLKDEGTDFVAQIEASAHGLDDSSTVNVTLSNGIDAAPAAVSRCFATTIREALNNTIRHSMARNVDITLRDFPALWQLRIQDDGALWNDGSQGNINGMMGSLPLVFVSSMMPRVRRRCVMLQALDWRISRSVRGRSAVPRCAARIMRGGGCSCPFPKRTMMRQRPQQRRRTYDASRNRR